jgi:hypothetical protein
MDAVTSTIAHEFAHSYELGDEYEAVDAGHSGELLQNNNQGINRINKHPNLTHHWLVKDASDKIDFSTVLWNRWMRIELSSTLVVAAANVAGNKIEVTIDANKAAFWVILNLFVNRNTYLRTRDINFNDDPTNSKYIEGPFPFDSADLTNGKITLTGAMTKNFPAGSVIYLPKERGGSPLPLIEPLVADYITNTNNGGPFDKKADCSIANRGPSNAPVIPNLVVANRQYVVAVYEGGGYFNCKVYRPSGQCRMRDDDTRIGASYPAFCPVCKYHLVNLINPDELKRLEAEYPRQEPAPAP